MKDSNQRSINLSVLSSRPEVSKFVHERFMEYVLSLQHLDVDYCNVSISKTGDIEVEEESTLEGEYCDEHTMRLVREVIVAEYANKQFNIEGWNAIDDLVNAFQNAGILFRQLR